MRAGELDRKISIQSSAGARNEYGERTETWAELASVWAKVVHLRGKELLAAQQIVPTAELEITMYWRGDLTESMRIVHDGKEYGIQHIAEIGRRKGLRILAQRPK
jgi:SPP1 family predicted phage head-tail adaptor